MKTKVLFLVPSLAGGGSERVMLRIIAGLDRDLFAPELGLVCRAQGPSHQPPGDVPVHELDAPRVRKGLGKIIRLIQKTRPDVVFSTLGHLNLALMLLKPLAPRGIRFIGRESCVVGRIIPLTPRPRLFSLLYRRLYPKFDRVVCQSRDMLEDLRDNFGLDESKMRIIHNPVDADELKRLSLAESAPPPPPKINLLAAGRLERQKGFDLLIRALSLARTPDLHLTIIGQGEEEHALKSLAAELGLSSRVSFPGFVQNPCPWMARADLFVLSSRFEGFPNVLIEALALGAPAASFACPGGINEIIIPGENGLLAPPEDSEGLAKTIDSALAARFDRKKIALATAERFGIEKIIRAYQNLLLNQDAPQALIPIDSPPQSG